MSTTLIVPGRQISAAEGRDLRLERYGVDLDMAVAVQVLAATRDAGAEVVIRDAADDDLVELQFTGGVSDWMRVDTLARRVGQNERSSVGDRIVRVPWSPTRPTTRGVADLVLEGMKLLKIDLIDRAAEAGAREIARQIEHAFEPIPGLYHLDERGQRAGLVKGSLPAGDAPFLVFIHGTFMNHSASFGKLVGTPEWLSLQEFYQTDHIVSLEHHTLSESPAENALALAQQLPAGAHVHLVTHSRGGLVGELLGLRALPESGLRPFELAGAVRSEDLATLRSLQRTLQEKSIRIDRFVRVACPARGTLLASDRLDRYLSLILNLVGAIPALEASEVYPFAKALILALIKQRANPAVLPGLEAQMPSSPTVHLLNHPDLKVDSELAIVAGDIEGQGLFGRLAVLATDLFFREDHDLVVDTDSMDEGPARSGPVFYSFLQGPEINHFSYFANDVGRQRIAAWLLHQEGDETPGFRRLERKPLPDLTSGDLRAADTELPVLFLIPGLMASHLKSGADRIWLSRSGLTREGLKRLLLGSGSDAVVVDGVLATPYQELVNTLQGKFKVVVFPYDWRRSCRDEGRRLSIEIATELSKHTRAVYILAHSAGGLVAQAMIAHDRSTWDEVCARGGRLVMLGSPTRGTYSVLQLLSGRGRLAPLLAPLDASRSAEAVASVFRTFPGLVELLPDDPVLEEWGAAWWHADDFRRRREDAHRVHVWLRDAVDPDHMAYVAGMAESTPSGVRPGDGEGLQFLGIGLGDGVVTEALGGLPGVPTWSINAMHGDLANHAPAFPAFVEILLNGATALLPAAPPNRMAAVEVSLSNNEAPTLFPNDVDLAAAAIGAAALPRAGKAVYPLRVSATHGGLEHARHPVAVGHYEGDMLVGAESFLDTRLGGCLGRRLAMNLYPGKRDTAEVILAPGCTPPGGIVVGLGQIGEITPEILVRGVTEAALRLALAVAESPAEARETQTRSWRSAAFSTVLMGTTGGRALGVETAVAAIVQGALMANRILRERKLWDQVRIDEVEFIELYEDIATHVAHVIRDLRGHLRIALEDQEDLLTADRLQVGEGGLLQRPTSEYAQGWWRRLQITAVVPESRGGTEGALQFVLLTDRARAEESLEPTQRALVDKLVEQTIADPFSKTLPATLYELLMPNTLKDQSYEMANLQLILDRSAAQYPWEMLAERDRNRVIQPMAVRMGMLRQLKVPQFRDRVQYPRGNNALVIGEPDLGTGTPYPALPGAAEEARAVEYLLRLKGFDVTSRLQKEATALSIVEALYAQEYRIIHIAAHGVFDSAHPERSGVLIGDGMVLTAAEISKLRIVPELVFLNCCHLGKLSAGVDALTPELQSTQRAWNKLAASIAEELIRIGVRAVVAAGWAVNDRAARLFATEFYTEMLSGPDRGYGHAVQHARERTYSDKRVGASVSNTWGAYQCYGDPGFTFGDRAAKMPLRVPAPVASHEVQRELDEIAKRAASPSQSNAPDLNRTRKLAAALPPEWINGKMLYMLGNAFGELGEFGEAIEYFKRAIQSTGTDEEVPFRAIEQLANLQARHAEDLYRRARTAGSGADEADARTSGLLEEAITNLRSLLAIADTPQRLALTGSYYKRLAARRTGDARQDALVHAAEFYGKAHDKQRKLGSKLDPYYTLNWVTFRVLAEQDVDGEAVAEMLDLIDQSRRAAPEKARREPDFWARVAEPDTLLARSLVQSDLDQSAERIAQLYRHAFDLGASPRERNTVTQHLGFVAEIFESKGRLAQAAAMRRILAALT